ncbi:hypothetical protein KFU94_00780 [Chloroflexi bacterium TSY]|nr:hypothetical protein [Chloroflexi bacterium TSY]
MLAAQPDNRRFGAHHRQNRALERGRAQAFHSAIELVHHYLVNNIPSTEMNTKMKLPSLSREFVFLRDEQLSRSSPQSIPPTENGENAKS